MACEARSGLKHEMSHSFPAVSADVGMACEARSGLKREKRILEPVFKMVGMACEARSGLKHTPL